MSCDDQKYFVQTIGVTLVTRHRLAPAPMILVRRRMCCVIIIVGILQTILVVMMVMRYYLCYNKISEMEQQL